MAYADTRLTASRRPFSKTARSSRAVIPDGSFRSARWKARAKHANVSKSRENSSRYAQQGGSVYRTVVAKGERKLFRARFAGLDSDQAEAYAGR